MFYPAVSLGCAAGVRGVCWASSWGRTGRCGAADDRTPLPARVTLDGRLHGIVSIGNVVKNRIDELEAEHSAMDGYITGER
jgi:hypothetical protein